MHHRPTIVLIAATLLACVAMPAAAVDNDTCLTCHSDLELTSEAGHKIGVDAQALAASVHGGLECTDCHSQEGNWEDVPHFQAYRKVDCGSCHDQAAATFGPSFHGRGAGERDPQRTGLRVVPRGGRLASRHPAARSPQLGGGVPALPQDRDRRATTAASTPRLPRKAWPAPAARAAIPPTAAPSRPRPAR